MSKTNEQLVEQNAALRKLLAGGAEKKLRAIPNVVHVSVGLKESQGKLSDQLCIRVYVKQKKPREKVRASELIPAEIDGVPTDVHVVGQFSFTLDNGKYRPIKGGIQITNRIIDQNPAGTGTQLSRGTLGCLAIDNTDTAPVLLSNWHVLYANTGADGDKVFQPAPTSIPAVSLLNLPLRPDDDNNKIGVLRRSVVNNKVDGAIAAVDVSSCCNCCGVHYSSEINGLSVAGRPPRNTIVGDQVAVSGMSVFKVGQATLRTEGLVVDDNYPSFSITKGGNTYNFIGQIAIQNVNNAQPFSAHGDSGSVVVNLTNNIVGLIFASGSNVPVHGTPQAFVSLANHIRDVLPALNIRIPYSPDVVVNSATRLADAPGMLAAPPMPEEYRRLLARLESHENTTALLALGKRHRQEVTYLINHRRPVTVTWHRMHGPALLATVMSAVRDGHYRLPQTLKGMPTRHILERMGAVLSQHGSPELREALSAGSALLNNTNDLSDLNQLIEEIAADQGVLSMLHEVSQ